MSGKKTWIIGSATDCDLVVKRESVSARHCQLTWMAPVFVLEDLRSSNGSFVNGQRIASPTVVTRSDDITLGPQILMPWPDSQMADIQETISIGREPDNDVMLDESVVSGHHAQLTVEQGRTYLQDAGSSNGTAIGPPFRSIQRAEISLRDTIYLGSFAIPAGELLEKARQSRKRNRPRGQSDSSSNKFRSAPNTSVAQASDDTPRVYQTSRLALGSLAVLLAVLCLAMVFSREETTPEPQASSATENRISETPPTPQKQITSAPVSAPVPVANNQSSKADSAASATLPLSPDRVKQNREAVLWVGIRVREPTGTGSALFPLATAFAVRPNVLVTTGWIASELERHSKIETRQPVAFHNGEEFPIQSFQVHPKYNVQEPTSDLSTEHNVGTLTLKVPVPTCDLADAAEVTSLSLESKLTLIGFKTTLGPKEPFDPLKVTKNDVGLNLQSTVLHRPNSPAVYKVLGDVSTQEGTQPLIEGCPVFGQSGRVVGILVPHSQATKMIAATACFPLLSK